jgi:uncharacterized protein with HEPN domain
MQREPRAFIADIVQACDAIADDVDGVGVDDYLSDRMIRSAVEREFTIIGEAIRVLGHIEPAAFARITAGRTNGDFRNQLAHGYMTVDDRLVWGYAVREAPKLREECARLLAELEGEPVA